MCLSRTARGDLVIPLGRLVAPRVHTAPLEVEYLGSSPTAGENSPPVLSPEWVGVRGLTTGQRRVGLVSVRLPTSRFELQTHL